MSLASHALVREAGLPNRELSHLACPRTLALVAQLDEADRGLDGTRDILCATLHCRIGGERDRSIRRGLLDLKRAVFNGASPERGWDEALSILAVQEDPALRSDLERWRERVGAHAALRDEAERVLEGELDEKLAAMRTAWRSSAFLTGLLVAQPDMFDGFVKLIEGTERLSPKRTRSLHLTGIAYWVRMASKTSPFSTFTLTALASIEAGGARWDGVPANRTAGIYHLSMAVLETLASRGLVLDGVARDAPLVVNGTLVEDAGGEQLLYLRRIAEPTARVGPSPARERFVLVRRTPQVARVLAKAAAAKPVAELARSLAADGRGPGADAWAALVRKLEESGALERSLGWSAARWGAPLRLAQALRAVGGRPGEGLAAGLEDVAAALSALPQRAPVEQATALAGIAGTVKSLYESVGAAPPAVAQGLVVHDVHFDRPVTVAREVVQGFSGDLDRLAAVLPLFNQGYALRLLMWRYLDARAGRRPVPLTRFLRDFHRDVYEPLASTPTRPLHPLAVPSALEDLPQARRLVAARSEYADVLRAAVSRGGGGAASLPREWLETAAESAREFWPAGMPLSVAHFAQLDSSTPESRLVVNQLAPGYGSCLARHTDARVAGGSELAGSLARHLREHPGPGEWIEVAGTFGFNGQVHEPVTERYIRYPGEAVAGEGQAEVPWSRLHVSATDEVGVPVLRDGADGGRLVPLVLGTLAPVLQPIACRILGACGPGFLPSLPLLEMLEPEGAAPAEVRRYPRVCCGTLVLMRETWRVPAAHLAAPQCTELARFRRLRSRAIELGMPRHVFVVPQRFAEWMTDESRPRRLRASYKPFYLDLDSPFSFRLFERYAATAGQTLTFCEALPSLDAEAPDAARRFARELVLETWLGAAHA